MNNRGAGILLVLIGLVSVPPALAQGTVLLEQGFHISHAQ